MTRYAQQIVVPEIGIEGQRKIATAKVLIVGAGGLGTPLATYLSSAGVGTIGIIDGDTVAPSNFNRQFMYSESEIGQSKAALLAAKLMEQNPAVRINAHREMLDATNIEGYINQYDIVCDCTDTAQARIVVDQACGRWQKPLVYAVVRGWEGYVTVLHYRSKVSLESIFSYQALIDNESMNCSVAGIVNAACGIAGSIQAVEVLKIILGLSSKLDGEILAFDTLGPIFRTFKLK